MIKLGSTIYNKLSLQADEAKELGLTELSNRVASAIGTEYSDENKSCTYSQFREDINRDMWKIATKIIAFYDLNSVAVEEVDEIVLECADKTVEELERLFSKGDLIKSSLEPKLPGEE